MKNRIPTPEEFPISFEQALRIAVGGRSVPDRFRIFRRWWKSELARIAKATGNNSRDNTDEVIVYFRANGVDESWFHNFRVGIAEYRAAQKTEQMRQTALARWKGKTKAPTAAKKRLSGRSRGRN
jgi:hypothetical protein